MEGSGLEATQQIDEEAFERVRDWKERLKRQCRGFAIFVVAVLAYLVLLRIFWPFGEVWSWNGFKFELNDYALESMVVAVVVAMVVAAAVSPRKDGDIRTRVNVISFAFLSQVISVAYPAYLIFLIAFSSDYSLFDAKALQKVATGLAVVILLVGLSTIIQEFEFSKWEARKKKEQERELFVKVFDEGKGKEGDGSFKKISKGGVIFAYFCYGVVVALLLILLPVVGGLVDFLQPKALFLFIIVILLGGLRTHGVAGAARASGVVWLPRTGEKIWTRLRESRKKSSDDSVAFYMLRIATWGGYVALSIVAIGAFMEGASGDSESRWLLVAGLLGFIVHCGFVVFQNNKSPFSFDVFSFIEQQETEQTPRYVRKGLPKNTGGSDKSFYFPKVAGWKRLCFPGFYREFAVTRTLEILNGERVAEKSDSAEEDTQQGVNKNSVESSDPVEDPEEKSQQDTSELPVGRGQAPKGKKSRFPFKGFLVIFAMGGPWVRFCEKIKRNR